MSTIRFRRGVAQRWTEVNPVLDEGEPGFETNTGRFKIGNGRTHWTELTYVAPGDQEDALTALVDHENSLTPHPVYDDGPTLTILYENAKV